ncbi:MAG: histidine--tRNA ligase [Eubacteriales bacterium]|nr:histidine--tRNA ligase [Eubacteriales bacterium]
MVIHNLKGVTDFDPAVMNLRNHITDTLRRNFELYGYQPLDTAMLNYRDLLTYKYGEQAEIVKEIYCLSDQGARDLGLRFDLTVPFCKYIALNRSLKLPFKRYEIGKVFRNGPVKAGRLREFIQCDVDVVGDGSRGIEIELLELAITCYLQLGITPQIQIGHRQILTGLLQALGVTQNHDAIIGVLDKIKKITREETLTELGKFLPADKAVKLLETVSLDLPALEKILPDNQGIAEIKELWSQLTALGLNQYCLFTPSLARGLNVYTGVVWEVFDAQGRYTSSLGGGGRYDQIITNFVGSGVAYPAVGLSFGLEPISTLLSATQTANPIKLLLVPMDTAPQCHALANQLRSFGIPTMLWTAKPKVGKAMEYAAATQIPCAAVIGADEINTGRVRVKNLTTGAQTDFALSDIKALAQYLTTTK